MKFTVEEENLICMYQRQKYSKAPGAGATWPLRPALLVLSHKFLCLCNIF